MSPVPVQQALPTNPPYATVGSQHRLWAAFRRRSGQAVPLVQVPPPQRLRSHAAARVVRLRGRQPLTVPAPAVVVPNPPLPTKTATIRRLAGWLLRRSRKAEQGWPQGVNLTPPPIVQPTGLLLAGSELTLQVVASDVHLEVVSSETTLPVVSSGTRLTIGDPNTFIS